MSQSAEQQIQLRIDESKMHTSYANTIRTSTTSDEVVLDFGINLPVQGGPGEPTTLVFNVGSRVILNWVGAKRLIASLKQAVDAYESHYGPIEMGPKQAMPKGASTL